MPIGLVLMAILIVFCMRSSNYYEHFSSNLFYSVWLVAGIFGLLLSLATFCRENQDNARAFLIHRGISVDRIFWSRVCIGLIIYYLTLFLPIGTVAVYFWTLGMDSVPVSPWQTVPAMVAVFYSTAFYFAGVVIACRNCRWLGTRCLPLSLAIGVFSHRLHSLREHFLVGVLLPSFGSHRTIHPDECRSTGLSQFTHHVRAPLIGDEAIDTTGLFLERFSDRASWRPALSACPRSISNPPILLSQSFLFSPEGDPWIGVRKSLSPYEDTLTPLMGADTQSDPPTPPRPEDRRAGWSFRSVESVGNRWDCSRIIMLQNVQGFYSPSGYNFCLHLNESSQPVYSIALRRTDEFVIRY